MILKDLNIIADTAAAQNLPVACTTLAQSYFQKVSESGGGRLGTQAISQHLEKLGGFQFVE